MASLSHHSSSSQEVYHDLDQQQQLVQQLPRHRYYNQYNHKPRFSSSAQRRILQEDEDGDGNDSPIISRNYTLIAMIPKGACQNSDFFENILQGCQDRAAREPDRVVVCDCFSKLDYFLNNNNEIPFTQGELITYLSERNAVDGISVAVSNTEDVDIPIAQAVKAGLPVVTVDSDAPDSGRIAYIGTDNIAMGREMGKVLVQLRPHGGTYVIVSAPSPNLAERELGLRQTLNNTRWTELEGYSPILPSEEANTTTQMKELAESNPEIRAMLPVYLNPMADSEAWAAFAEPYINANRTILFVGTDWTDGQLDLLRQGYVHGLVGQLPYEMGWESASKLIELQSKRGNFSDGAPTDSVILGTNLIEILRIPLDLPTIDFDYMYLGTINILGYVLFSVVALLSIGFAGWTFFNRKKYVVRASQPTFLYMICFGALILGSSIIAFGIDDEPGTFTQDQCDVACMTIPWLICVGFSLIFSALFSKTWRINRLFHQANKFKRLKVTTMDVILPMILLLTANIVILACWTALNPVHFIRKPSSETDLWNRVIASSGMCRTPEGQSSVLYWVLLGVVNIGALGIAMLQAYHARDIQTEFSESKYIALVFASMTQAFLVGGPVLAIERDSPYVAYILQTTMVFLLCTVILSLIFVPKILHQKERDSEDRDKKRVHVTGLAPTGNNSSEYSTVEQSGVGVKMQIWKRISTHPDHHVHEPSVGAADVEIEKAKDAAAATPRPDTEITGVMNSEYEQTKADERRNGLESHDESNLGLDEIGEEESKVAIE